ncbi:hypothetical protein A8C32_02420 [Flavivirga aquatica]|uniref:DUF2946 domain-containing protein n=1 Tax=Flavivirga aquatica TaxID=1849968 RepID=A0A1E5TAH0_9FLAO|nr:hypothetical protein [Flavivirga aquatica]OEK08326.1 hypothetical protein A8C32_02420 [Flavivirga aquatica]
MKKIKRFSSFLLVVFIFMNHLISFIHAFEHQNDTIITISSNELEYDQNSDVNERCCFCDIYFNLKYSQLQPLSYSLIVPNYISYHIIDKQKGIKGIVLFRKKSRSPPFSIT